MPFVSTHTFQLSVPLPNNVTRADMISTLHAHENMFNLQPLIRRFEEVTVADTGMDAADPHFDPATPLQGYIVGENIEFIPGLGSIGSKDIEFPALLQNTAEGVRSAANAPAGVKVRSAWRVEQAPDSAVEQFVLVEDGSAEAFVLLMPFVKSSMEKAHSELCNKLVEKAGQ